MLKHYHLCLAEVECKLMCFAKACKCVQLLLQACCAFRDIKMRSSAYSNNGTVTPMSVGASMSAVVSKCFSSPSKYSPNSVGLPDTLASTTSGV